MVKVGWKLMNKLTVIISIGDFLIKHFLFKKKVDSNSLEFRITGTTWINNGNYNLNICSMEFYGA